MDGTVCSAEEVRTFISLAAITRLLHVRLRSVVRPQAFKDPVLLVEPSPRKKRHTALKTSSASKRQRSNIDQALRRLYP